MVDQSAREKAFETEICEWLASHPADHPWLYSENDAGYDRELALFPDDVFAWLEETQPEQLAKVVKTGTGSEAKQRRELLAALAKKLSKPMEQQGGTLNVLRNGFRHVSASFDMCQFKPASSMGETVAALYAAVRLRVVRQVRYSTKNDSSIDLVFFVNGIPVATVELKSSFTQSVQDAIAQYRKDRLPAGEPLLGFGTRALVHFALDDDEAFMTTRLAGGKTRFLPFNQGTAEDGAGNDPSVDGDPPTAYLWKRVWERHSWLHILGNLMYLEDTKETDPITGVISTKTTLVFPRYHQWEAVHKILDAVRAEGPGHRYLIAHAAGSGKTKTISWVAHGLARLFNDADEKVFDKVLVVSDRRILDKQLQEAVRQIDHQPGLVQMIDTAAMREAGGGKGRALSDALSSKALIVVVTIGSFETALEIITDTEQSLAGNNYAVLVDEAHTSQSGSAAINLRKTLVGGMVEVSEDDGASAQDILNRKLEQFQMLKATTPNISFFAFTATPKAKTMELFGRKNTDDELRSFDYYSMKQAIQEGFILDVLPGYQTYKTAFKIEQIGKNGVAATIDPSVDSRAASRGIMRFVELHPWNISQKVEIIVEHFRANVEPLLDGHAKAMVVTDSRQAAVRYKVEIDKYIATKRYGLKTLVAYSGSITDAEYGLIDATEATINDPGTGSDLSDAFARVEYRVMIAADKFQTGFDQPLLCAMYVDKPLPGVHAVQTLSRLNRAFTASTNDERKDRVFVLDFRNEAADILAAFKPYYRDAHVETATDPNLVHDLVDKITASDIYTMEDVEKFAAQFWGGTREAKHAARNYVRPAAKRYRDALRAAKEGEDPEAVARLELLRKDIGTFVRMYEFMSQVIDYEDTGYEKLHAFMRHLLPLIKGDDGQEEIDLSAINVRFNRPRAQAKVKMALDEDGAISGIAPGEGLVRKERKLLSEVVQRINELFGRDFDENQALAFISGVAASVQQDANIQDQIDNNTEEQFADSPDVRYAVVDAAIAMGATAAELADAITGDDDRAAEAASLVGKLAYRERRARMQPIVAKRRFVAGFHWPRGFDTSLLVTLVDMGGDLHAALPGPAFGWTDADQAAFLEELAAVPA